MTMRSWIRSLFARPATRPIRKATRRGRLSLEALEERAVPATFTVLNTDDDGDGSLRWAVGQANSSTEADTIEFGDGSASGGTNFLDATRDKITLTSGQLFLTDAATTTITGSGANLLSISGNKASRVFFIDYGASAALSGLTITGGNGAPGYGGDGGGIQIFEGRLELSNCNIIDNTAGGSGGGLVASGNSTLTMTNCTFSGNSTNNEGGAVWSAGVMTATNCTFNDNSAGFGGGLVNLNNASTLTNCTVSGNSAGGGGGVANGRYGTPMLTLINCTVSGNSAGAGGGIWNSSGGKIRLGNTIVAGNTDGSSPDVSGGVISLGNNLIGKTNGSTGWVGSDLTGTNAAPLDPKLAPLGNYGGPTPTMAPLPGCPAIDTGSNDVIPAGVTTDQRGADRIAHGVVDIGALEVADNERPSAILSIVTGARQNTSPSTAFATPLQVHLTANGPVAGAVITYTVNPSGNGAAATLSSATATTGPDGTASVTATANAVAGSYTVTASAAGAWSVTFQLGNADLVVVTTAADVVDSTDGLTSLREAIDLANARPTPDLITFDPDVFATPQTITLTSGQLTLTDTDTTTITGPGANLLSISGNHASRVFGINYGASAELSGLTITEGNASGGGLVNEGTATLTNCIISGNGIFVEEGGISGSGGGVFNSRTATLTLTDCTVSGNSLTLFGGNANGGGVFNEGTATLTNCTVSANGASGAFGAAAGGVFNSGTATLTNCTVTGNSADGGIYGSASGGGVFNSGTATLSDCTVSGNSSSVTYASATGGGVFNEGTATLTNCTVSANFAGGELTASGGGVFNSGTATLTNCTVTGNVGFSATSGIVNGGGVFNSGTATLTNCTISRNGIEYFSGSGVGLFNSGTATLTNTIVAGQLFGGDLFGTITGSNNLIGGDPLLGPLADNGGPTQTMALLPGSPAINAGTATGAPSTDQRGIGRVGAVDVGAFESRGFTLTYVSGSNQSAPINAAFAAPLVVQVTSNFGEPVAGGVVTFTAPGSGASTTTAVTTAVIADDGQASTSVTANGTGGSYDVTASANGAAGTADFPLTNGAATASISGVVYVDVNQNGLFDGNEPGLDSVTIELQDGSGHMLDTTTTVGGFYLFDGLNPGTYRIHEVQPSGVADGSEHLGSLGGTIVGNDVMQLTLNGVNATDYVFVELGQQVTHGDAAGIGFWQNKNGQALIKAGGAALPDWLTANFGNVFGNTFSGANATGAAVAAFYKDQLFKQTGKSVAGPAKVDAQFMAVALAAYFTNSNLAGNVASSYGFNVTDTGLGRVVNVGSAGAAFGVSNGATRTVMQLLQATNDLTDTGNTIAGFAYLYDTNGDGVVSAAEAQQRALANGVFTFINEPGDV